MREFVDIVNTFNQITGKAEKDEAHQKGLWHRTVSFILVDKKNELIFFQDKKKPSERNTKDYFVKLNGGHLKSGEKVEDGVRELKEELGIEVSFDQVIPIGINQTAVDFSKDFKIREFMYYFIVDVENVLDKFKFIDGEVSSVIYFNPIDALEVVLGGKQSVKAKVFDSKNHTDIELGKTAFKGFTDDNLYLRIFLAVKRYFEGEDKRYIVI